LIHETIQNPCFTREPRIPVLNTAILFAFIAGKNGAWYPLRYLLEKLIGKAMDELFR
jgi:hypothetical protein